MIAAVLPLESSRQAEFLQNEVPGVHVPDRVVERMRRAEGRGAGRAAAEGVVIACEIAEELRGEVAGIQISGVREGVEAVLGVVGGAGGPRMRPPEGGGAVRHRSGRVRPPASKTRTSRDPFSATTTLPSTERFTDRILSKRNASDPSTPPIQARGFVGDARVHGLVGRGRDDT